LIIHNFEYLRAKSTFLTRFHGVNVPREFANAITWPLTTELAELLGAHRRFWHSGVLTVGMIHHTTAHQVRIVDYH